MIIKYLPILLFPVFAVAQKDTINVTDSLGKKQGHWVFMGGDFPNSGVSSGEILEEGDFVDNERTGIWYRYGSSSQLKAVMLFRIDKKTKTSVRDQFYNYQYHANGQLKRKPVIGKCRSSSDYFTYDESGNILEIELFDSLCNTSYKLQRIQTGEMDAVSIFQIDDKLTETATDVDLPYAKVHFDQNGEFCVDYNHQIFQVGSFENGQFVSGREYHFDDMMRVQRIRFYESGKPIRTMIKKVVQ